MNIIKIVALLAGLSGIFFLMSYKKEALSSFNESKNKTEEHKSPTAGITIIKKWDMPDKLKEISGLSHIDNTRFACVQDELGIVFIYNTSSSVVEKEIPFGGAGDYEGLAIVGENAWVLRSDGKLLEVSNINSTNPEVKEHSTILTLKQNSEGLCYDKKNNRLLIAIKGVDPAAEGFKGIYAFDLSSKKLNPQPVFKIDLQNGVFGENSSGKKKKGTIMPSDIAIHPVSGDIYIPDGRNSSLLITDSKGTVKKLYQLKTREFAQPEGITFNQNGELFISNEGKKQPGNILQVKID